MKKYSLLIVINILVLSWMPGIINAQLSQQQRRAMDVQKLQTLEFQFRQEAVSQRTQALQRARQMNWPVRRVYPDGTIMELQRLDQRGLPVYYVTHNRNAAITVKTDQLWPESGLGFNLTGNGMRIGQWDGGPVWPEHPEFGGTAIDSRVYVRDYDTNGLAVDEYSSHATHVAGTLIAEGMVDSARGMVYLATLDSYDWNSDKSEVTAAAADGLLISNHSYGSVAGWYRDFFGDGLWTWFGGSDNDEDPSFGFYGNNQRDWDQIVYNARFLLPVFAAGNDRQDTGPQGTDEKYYVWNASNDIDTLNTSTSPPPPPDSAFDTMAGPSLAKNVLAVGAIDDIPGGVYSDTEQQMMPFSSWGPADDGRIKPDIVANGDSLYSTINSTSADNYEHKSGTSMATPNAAGSMLLLQQLYQNEYSDTTHMRAATLKALVIQTADDAGRPGPDYEYGWGILNTRRAAQTITNRNVTTTILEDSLSNGTEITVDVSVSGSRPLIATLAWTDPPPQQPSSRDKMLVNDLDMVISRPGIVHSPWILNRDQPEAGAVTGDNITDNVEQLYIGNPEQGVYSVVISHKDNLMDGVQHFSLVVNAPMAGFNRPPLVQNPLGSITVDEDFTEFFAGHMDSVFYDTSPELEYMAETDGNSEARIQNDSLFVSSVADYFGESLVRVTAQDSQYSRSDTLGLNILPVNDPPEPFALLSPADNFFNEEDVQMRFQWETAEDIDDDDLNYLVQIGENPDQDTLISTTGTDILVNVLELELPRNSPIFWNVFARDEQDTTASGNGSFSFFLSENLEIVEFAGETPEEFVLYQNYPNPFNSGVEGTTSIAYGLPQAGYVQLRIFDINGRLVRTLIDGSEDAGWHKAEWDGRGDTGQWVSSGMYFYRFVTDGFQETKKLLFLK